MTATPIGNLGDVSLRALEVLGAADVIACEDTRISARLLHRYAISTPLTPYHEHNAQAAGPRLLRRLAAGEVVALVSDAGTPLVSDPGYRLVRAAIEAGVHVTSLPGPSAVTAALSIAGLPTDRFFFAGFLPSRGAARRRALGEFAAVPGSLVVFESPRRLGASLADMAAVLGPREAAVGRELTKRFEEVRRGRLDATRRRLRWPTPSPRRDRRRRRPARTRRARRGARRRRYRRTVARRLGARPAGARGRRGRAGDRAFAPRPLRPGAGTAGAAMNRRRRAERAGRAAETACAWLLRLKGYRLLARRYRSGLGEIDIVARRGALIAVVEVKARRDYAAAVEAVDSRQRARIARATEMCSWPRTRRWRPWRYALT